MNRKTLFSACFFFLFFAMPLFAQGIMPSGMTSLAEEILGIFTGPFVTTILIILLCGAAIAFAYNKDNEKMKSKIIAIGISIAILIGARGIVTAIWNAAGG